MESTFLKGDQLIANKFVYWFREPKQFEPIIFKFPQDPYNPEPAERYAKLIRPIYWDKKLLLQFYKRRDFIKRLIGVPGDTLQLIDKIYILTESILKRITLSIPISESFHASRGACILIMILWEAGIISDLLLCRTAAILSWVIIGITVMTPATGDSLKGNI